MIEFTAPALSAPDGSIIGMIEEGSGAIPAEEIPRLTTPQSIPDTAGNYILDHALCRADAVVKARTVSRLLRLRRSGATIVVISHDEGLLESCADEIWWIRDGELIARGDPSEVLGQYRRHVADLLRSAGRNQEYPLSPVMRNGDGRAVLERIELTGEDGSRSTVFRSGEDVAIRVTVKFLSDVEDPVIGILIRTRIGLNVYGTNTELEQVKVGPVKAGWTARIVFRFGCDLCPGDYSVTAASHDPNGLWHDWMEDAAAFAVTDSRYTAGVAKLRARVEFEIESQGQSAST